MLAEVIGLAVVGLFAFLAIGDRALQTLRCVFLGDVALVVATSFQTSDAAARLMVVIAGAFLALSLSLFAMCERVAISEPVLSDVRCKNDGLEILLKDSWTPLLHYSDLEVSIYGLMLYGIVSTAILAFSRGLLTSNDSIASVAYFAINVGVIWAFSLACVGRKDGKKITIDIFASLLAAMFSFVVEILI